MFTGFSSYDDEGALMIPVKQYLSGRTIYVDVPGARQPGPVSPKTVKRRQAGLMAGKGDHSV
jgi:hypothetical protein